MASRRPIQDARREGRGRRSAASIAQVIDKNLADAILWTALRDEALRHSARQMNDDRLGKILDFIPVRHRTERNDDVQPFAARFRKAFRVSVHREMPWRASFPRPHAAIARPRPDRGRTAAVGVLDRLDRRIPRMEFDHVQLRGMYQGGRGGNLEHRRIAWKKRWIEFIHPGIRSVDVF